MRSLSRIITLATLVVFARATPGQTGASTPSGPPPNPCAGNADRHRFDFWMGEWQVTTPDGRAVGSSSVQSMAGGCGLLENWTALNGTTGKSLNAFNPVAKQWQQYWVGQGGAVTEYRESEWRDGSLSLISRPSASASAQPMQRLTFTPVNDSTVRQHGELSNDGGTTWTTTYDFYYHRRRS